MKNPTHKIRQFSLMLLTALLIAGTAFAQGRGGERGNKGGEQDRVPCFEIVYPISYEMPDGSIITGNDENEIALAMREWYTNNPDSREKPELIFPITIVFADGETVEINSEEELIEVRKDCYEEREDDRRDDRDNDRDNDFASEYRKLAAKLRAAVEAGEITREEAAKILEEFRKEYTGKGREDRRDDFRPAPCFDLVFPVTHIMPDGTEITADTREEMFDLIKEWYTNNPDVKERPKLKYPVTIVDEEGNETVINSEEEMIAAKEDCIKERRDEREDRADKEFERRYNAMAERLKKAVEAGKMTREQAAEILAKMKKDYYERKRDDRPDFDRPAPCFDLVFPVTHIMPDGTEITADTREEMFDLIKEWYTNNPDVKERPKLKYPVTIVDEEGNETVINSEEEMIAAKEDCIKERRDEREDRRPCMACFELVYPVTYTMPDGSTITGADEIELRTAIMEWYKAHPDVREQPEMQFPIEIVYEDGTVVSIADRDALIAAFKDCFSDDDEDKDEDPDSEEGGVISGIEEITGISNTLAFPNPASDMLKVRFTAENSGNIKVTLTDYSGNALKTLDSQALIGSNTVELDVTGVATGSYFVRIATDKGTITVPVTVVR